MIYIKTFKDYDGFKNVFGLVEHGNGVVSRRNKIILGFLKDRRFFHYCATHRSHEAFFHVATIPEAIRYASLIIGNAKSIDGSQSTKIDFGERILSDCMYSSTMELDSMKGLSEEDNPDYVRYVKERKVYKMKAGKFIKRILGENACTSVFPEQLMRILEEEFTSRWKSHAGEAISRYVLKTGKTKDDFKRIYSSDRLKGNFCSCMTDRNRSIFYVENIDATAAWIEDRSGMIVARCIIYDKVYEFPDGRTPLRLAERQYSSEGKDQYKRMLIDKLVAKGLIDGYKAIGASCNDSLNFVDVNGNSMRRKFFIESRWQKSKPLSYQDSFKWADTVHCRAYNFDRDYEYRLDTTSLTINSTDMRWSEYHGRFLHKRIAFYDQYHKDYRLAENAKPCIYKGKSIYIDLSNDDDFRYSPLRKAHVHISEYV